MSRWNCLIKDARDLLGILLCYNRWSGLGLLFCLKLAGFSSWRGRLFCKFNSKKRGSVRVESGWVGMSAAEQRFKRLDLDENSYFLKRRAITLLVQQCWQHAWLLMKPNLPTTSRPL